MVPTAFTLSLVQNSDTPEIAIPAVTACYDSDEAFREFGHAELVTISIQSQSNNWTGVFVKSIGHLNHCDCPAPKVSTTHLQARSESALKFMASLSASPTFYWIISTPSFEGRALVNTETNTITDKQVVQRTLH